MSRRSLRIFRRCIVYLARKITRAKWTNRQLGAQAVPADAVTADLRTKNNALSFWQCGNGTSVQVRDAALALAAGGQRVENIEIVWVSYDDLLADGQQIVSTPGRTPVTEMIERHMDLSRLDYVQLGKVADRVVSAISKGWYKRLTKQAVRTIILDAVQQRRLDPSDLQERVRIAVEL